ncbi:MAG: NgoFVII family restriction endonuclease [Lentisphaeria bacterium]|nr:NgoFVII family restriction endonuclease [Lentisphaeria bacterium]
MSKTCRLHFDSPCRSNLPTKSGLNWGNANAHVNTEDAYIPIRHADIANYPALFPIVNQGQSIIDVTWDDGVTMTCSFEGTQDFNGVIYPKQISSYDDKSVLGHYLRSRIGVSPTVIITDADLDQYGRNHIDITKNDDGTFFFDFSV